MHLTKISQEDADIVLYRNTYIVFQFSKQLENKPVNSFWRHGLEMKCQITNIGWNGNERFKRISYSGIMFVSLTEVYLRSTVNYLDKKRPHDFL